VLISGCLPNDGRIPLWDAPWKKEPKTCHTLEDYTQLTIWAQYRGQVYTVSRIYLEDPNFNLIKWYQQCMIEANEEASYHVATEPTQWPSLLPLVNWMLSDRENDVVDHLHLGGVQVD